MSGAQLTIITVVKDDDAGLARTLASLVRNDLNGVEYVVIDSSADRAALPQALDAHGISAIIEWTPPAGIYAAMNAGLARATGEYVHFLNAGDELTPGVLTELHRIVETSRPAWLFGDIEIVGTDGVRTRTPRWDYAHEQATAFSRGFFPPHQGTIVRTALLRECGGFDVSYAVAADYAAFLAFSDVPPQRVELVLATFHEGGTSTTNWRTSVSEFHRARRTILHPHGFRAIQERANTARQFLALGIYRTLQRRRSA